jgi:putative lipoic acid-binding regulatory protein
VDLVHQPGTTFVIIHTVIEQLKMADNGTQSKESLITFPCDFTLKVFGFQSQEFESSVLMIIHKHVANLSGRAIQSRPSENGKYLALTITVHVDSKEQLDNIYRDLSSSPHVLMAL